MCIGVALRIVNGSRTEDSLHEDRCNSIINYLLVAVIKYMTKTALRTRFLLVHSLRLYSHFIMVVVVVWGVGWS